MKGRVAVFCALALAMSGVPGRAGIVDLTARLESATLSDRLADDLAASAGPVELLANENEPLQKILETQCAHITERYLSLFEQRFFALNPNVEVVGSSTLRNAYVLQQRRILVPFCLRKVDIEMVNDDHTDCVGPQCAPLYWTRRQATLAPSQVEALGVPDPTAHVFELGAASTRALMIPLEAPATKEAPLVTLKIPDDRLDEFKRSLINEQGQPISQQSSTKRGVLVAAEEGRESDCDLTGTRIKEVDLEQTLRALGFASTQARMLGGSSNTPAKVLLVDSGLSANDVEPFHSGMFAERFDRLDLSDLTYRHEGHGAQVATLIMGGVDLAPLHRLFEDNLLKIQVVNALERGSDGNYSVSEAKLRNAITRYRFRDFIFNLSVTFPTNIDIASIIGTLDSTLIVVAAGNSHHRLGPSAEAWPAMSGGGMNSTVMTVGALDGSGRMAKFSNYGREFLDIGALGCNVRTFSYDAEKKRYLLKRVFGTSFAAPQVTGTAALLKALRPDLSPLDLKHHLLASADLDSDLRSAIADGRILDRPKALYALYADVIEYEEEPGRTTLLVGRLLSPGGSEAAFKLGDDFYERKVLRKLSRFGQQYMIYKSLTGQKLDSDPIDAPAMNYSEIQFEDRVNEETVTLKTAKIRDIVFARFPYWEN